MNAIEKYEDAIEKVYEAYVEYLKDSSVVNAEKFKSAQKNAFDEELAYIEARNKKLCVDSFYARCERAEARSARFKLSNFVWAAPLARNVQNAK